MIISFDNSQRRLKYGECCLIYQDSFVEVLVNTERKEKISVYKEDLRQILFIGRIENKYELIYLFNTIFNTHETDAEFLFKLIQYIGVQKTIRIVEGVFLALYVDEKIYQIFNDALGQYPLYYSFNGNQTFRAFSKVRDLPLNFKQKRISLKSKDELLKPNKPIDFAPFIGYKRLVSGGLCFSISNTGEVISKKQFSEEINHTFSKGLLLNNGKYFLEFLERRTEEIGKKIAEDIAVPLSGGIDSGAIASLLNAQGKKIHSYSIGTEFSDEYKEAQQTADHIGSIHKTLLLSEDKVLKLMEELIVNNEIFDPLCVEILLPFGLMFQAAQKDNLHVMCTGYGSDLILGGTLKNIPSNKIFDASVKLIQRTFWTNEFSPFHSEKYGIDLYHPFWSNKLIRYGLNIKAEFKIKNEIEKFIFRTQIGQTSLLPKETVWRKKVGIHEGSSVKKLMLKALSCNEEKLSDFIYHHYRKNILKTNQ